MGPMVAATRFLNLVRDLSQKDNLTIKVTLHGSLAYTGKGHASDKAIILGLLGFLPHTLDPEQVDNHIDKLYQNKSITLDGFSPIGFDPEEQLVFDFGPPLDGHPNGMVFYIHDDNGKILLKEVYYSIGGGFVMSEDELNQDEHLPTEDDFASVPFPFRNAVEMLEMARESKLSIAEMKKANELTRISENDFDQGIELIWDTMNNCIDRGLTRQGHLPGSLNVRRRAKEIMAQLKDEEFKNSKSFHICNEWLSVYAMAVNEENAAGGQVVTAPTNGAAGVIPAVLRYYMDFTPNADKKGIETFLLTAAAIGEIIKSNASISGAEVGCQGEVGSASSMAAAGFCAVLGGTPPQIENAAEIALEHHLGMTCDPVAGLVQVPCIERNGLGAVKAVTSCSLALRGDGTHIIPLDNCIETMRQTGEDMSNRYKETSQGGLAVNLPEC